MANASIPQWQINQLNQMASAGQLSGVDPSVLGAMDQAESSGNPGPPNSVGAGGYFGMPGSMFPNMGADNPTEFGAEAQGAASTFAGLRKQYGGDNYLAEGAYQVGPGAVNAQNMTYSPSPGVWAPLSQDEGVGIMQSLGIPEQAAGNYPAISSNTGQSAPTSTSPTTTSPSSSSSSINVANVNPFATWGPSWLPWNWGADIGNATFHVVFPFIVIGLGLIFIVYGLKMTFFDKTSVNILGNAAPGAKGPSSGGPQSPSKGSQAPAKASKVAEAGEGAEVAAA